MTRAPQPGPAPAEPEPVRVPQPTDPDVLAARRKKMEEGFMNRKGRASTELSTSGPTYSRTTLG